ncbi:4689_t:CDS:2 [Paraglomus occultum]|uniref:4689_t:CDS:1 n=1 Tax=Paraglomus occultum TaxID=144539 RepID=A0A9N9BLF7_9GLOM|nr:4689_t:CDS:2 [Paraglomus occultum]
MDISEKQLADKISEINPYRGEVYLVEIIDAQGYEQKGNDDDERLAVVVSNNQQNAKKNVIVIVPLSSKVKKIYPFQVATFFQGKPGKAKCEQVRAITIERFKEKLGELTEKEMNEIEEKLVFVLHLEGLIKRKVQAVVQKYLKLSSRKKTIKNQEDNTERIELESQPNMEEIETEEQSVEDEKLNEENAKAEFLHEVVCNKLFSAGDAEPIVPCLGISQDPTTKNYIMVMQCMEDGSLRQHLQKNYGRLYFYQKFTQLEDVAEGLSSIHKKGLIHRDLHSGNILSFHTGGRFVSQSHRCCITDLGLCRPADEVDDKKIYGVLPYVAPEVIRGEPYTQAADIYSFGMVAYEVLSGLPPYYDLDYDSNLALLIFKGLRPDLSDVQAPQLLKDLIKRLENGQVIVEVPVGEVSKIIPLYHPKFHPQSKFISKPLDFKNLPESQNSQEINDEFYGGSKNLELDLNDFNLDELTIQEDPQEQSSHQAQIQIPPKQ